MNKKFLSAILFGAMLATSAGTFVSCKDYDDDIKGLQTQIDTNKTAIAELQKLVGAGNWVTSVAASGENLVVTMSNGTTATIAGIKGADGKDGVDGKNAAEWTISEDGFWCKDGEKTTNVAVAQNGKDGKDGVTAPSPTISDNGMWVVYSWDAAKGEFVAEETEIPAAGTSAYVVLKNGVYTLNIADETGEFVEVSLPATAESFTINGIANKDVKVVYAYGEWKTPTKKAEKELFDKLVAEFPELKEYKDKDFVAQSGKLPFIVSPANVELTKDYTFTLVDMKGKDAGATLANPTQGMPDVKLQDGVYESRAAEGTAVWSLDFVPALNKKGNGYEASTEVYSLVVSGAKGIIAATPYVYKYSTDKQETALSLAYTSVAKLYNEDGMDIFAKATETDGALELSPTVLKGMYILEATDPAQVEELGISIEGSVVTVAHMPKGKNVAGIGLKLTAIAVNGSVASDEFTLDVTNVIAATGALADVEETLAGTYTGKTHSTKQTIWWSLEDLELSALQMKNFEAANRTFEIYTYNEDGNKVSLVNDATVTLYSEKNVKKSTEDYTKAAYICAELDAAVVVPGDYEVVLQASNNDGVILKAESALTLVNPEEELLTIKESLLDEEGVVIAATNGTEGVYHYDLNTIFTKEASSSIASFKDLDWEYDNETYREWWQNGREKINPNYYTKWNEDGTVADTEVDKVRTFEVTYNLFGNPNNQRTIEFKVKWTSTIYAEDATDVITMTPAKLKIKFDPTSATSKDNEINFVAITSAIYAQGSEKGKTYNLFKTETGQTTGGENPTFNYAKPIATGAATTDYVLKGKNYVEIPKNTDAIVFGLTQEQLNAYMSQTAKSYITNAMWTNVWDVAQKYYDEDGSRIKVNGKDKEILAVDKPYTDVFTTYKSLIDFTMTDEGTDGTKTYNVRAAQIKSVIFDCVNEDDAAYFSMTKLGQDCETGNTLTAKASKNIDKTSLVEGKKVIPMTMSITDIWGKVMVYEFNVEISL